MPSTHPASSTGSARRRSIGELCVGGDWACANGDLETLGDIARRLTALVAEPLHCRLVELAALCRLDSEGAVAMWMSVKDEVLASKAGPPP